MESTEYTVFYRARYSTGEVFPVAVRPLGPRFEARMEDRCIGLTAKADTPAEAAEKAAKAFAQFARIELKEVVPPDAVAAERARCRRIVAHMLDAMLAGLPMVPSALSDALAEIDAG